jgi:hypothetical protein
MALTKTYRDTVVKRIQDAPDFGPGRQARRRGR